MEDRLLDKIGEYRDAILDSLPLATSVDQRVEIKERAVGWSVFIILVGTHAGMRGMLRRLDNHWSREEQAEAVERYALDLFTQGESKFSQTVQMVKSVPNVKLRPDEETRIRKKIVAIMKDVLLTNPELKDLLTPQE